MINRREFIKMAGVAVLSLQPLALDVPVLYSTTTSTSTSTTTSSSTSCRTPPTSVKINYFISQSLPYEVRLNWETAYEMGLIGFNIYRDDGMELRMINPELLPPLNPGQDISNAYKYYDGDAERGKHYKYWLEWIGVEGNTMFGPCNAYIPVHNIWISPLIKGE
jgi:hypothetical protein